MNNYLQKILELASDKIRAAEYAALIEDCLSRSTIDGYTEKHHILPKCVCDTDDQRTDKNNLVILSAKEHFIAHQLLSEIFTGPIKRKMLYALSGLCTLKDGRRIFTPEEYSVIKEASRQAKKGIPLTDKHKQKIRDSFSKYNPNKGRVVSDDTKRKQSVAKIGTPRSQAAKDSISNTLKGVPKGPQPLLSCIVCRKFGGSSAIKQHHYNKCTKGD